ncbi:nucleotidyltransferase domain-containing protein [Actinospica sp.]|jgi:hypothetical protein|uniref:nucleotidyltransferase domain-containing protein n=1 Tax=Actinospica sp. TaxID=1872142 RepID=UPI002BFD45DF|nr:hypothetical protein [Actinospica sp.]HWG27057.1 hypothetical protein [Actinospica sp.]
MSERLPDGGVQVSPADIEALEARWASSWNPSEVAERLAGVDAPWCVAAGWALDLFRGSQIRAHGDIEIAVPAARFTEVRERFTEYVFDAVGDHRIWENATSEALAATHQTWLRDPCTDNYLLDVFREPHDGDVWICRRDERIRLPYRDVIRHSADGIPYLSPEFVLLFKAKACRSKDQADFDATVPLMTRRQRGTLASLLERVHPGHPWLAALSQPF